MKRAAFALGTYVVVAAGVAATGRVVVARVATPEGMVAGGHRNGSSSCLYAVMVMVMVPPFNQYSDKGKSMNLRWSVIKVKQRNMRKVLEIRLVKVASRVCYA